MSVSVFENAHQSATFFNVIPELNTVDLKLWCESGNGECVVQESGEDSNCCLSVNKINSS